MTGYKDLPDETDVALAGDWLHTGDVGRFDEDGYLYIVDRTKDMIITGGFNVYPREVEDVLSAHPAVSVAMVIGVPDAKWGEAVKAVIVLRPGYEAKRRAHGRAAGVGEDGEGFDPRRRRRSTTRPRSRSHPSGSRTRSSSERPTGRPRTAWWMT